MIDPPTDEENQRLSKLLNELGVCPFCPGAVETENLRENYWRCPKCGSEYSLAIGVTAMRLFTP